MKQLTQTKSVARFAKLVVAMLIGLAFSLQLTAQTINKDFIDGKIYFKLKANAAKIPAKSGVINVRDFSPLQKVAQKYNVKKINNPFYTTSSDKLQRTYSVEFQDYAKVEELIIDLEKSAEIEYAEKAPLYKLLYTPNDADYLASLANSWHLDKINAKGAWDICKGDINIHVADIDNGIMTSHPELINQIIEQVDLAENDNDATPDSTSAEWSHGSHTAGLITATTDNNLGVASIGYNLGLLAIKAGRKGDGALVAGFEGITWAADHGARVISMSWGGPQFVQTLQNIVDYAYNKGCVLVASAGNNGDGASDPATANALTFPAALNHVISVGATNGNDKMAAFSQYGTWIDVCAPGGYQNDGALIWDVILNRSVYSLAFGTGTAGYTKMTGTSMSCPIVAGLCGLMLAKDPTLTADRLESYLKAGCDNINALQDATHTGMTGAGRINAYMALKMVADSIRTLVANFSASSNVVSLNGFVNYTDHSLGNPISWSWSFSGATPSTSTIQNPQHIVYSTPGIYPVTLTVTDASGFSTYETKQAFVSVNPPASSEWLPQATAFPTMYRGIQDISVVDNNTTWATAYDGSGTGATIQDFTRTTDGGITWIPGTIGANAGLGLGNISAVSGTKAWVTMYSTAGGGKIMKTDDGGITWVAQPTATFTAPDGFPNVVSMWNDQNGWCMGDPNGGTGNYFEIYTTTDGGTTWVRVPDANMPVKLAAVGTTSPKEMGWTGIYDFVGDTIWFGTNRGRIFRSIDKGISWTAVVTGSADINKITMLNHLEGYMVYRLLDAATGGVTAYELRRTTDGGNTWNLVTPAGNIFKSDIAVIEDVPGMLVSIGGMSASGLHGSSYSLDNGSSWNVIDTVQYTSTGFKNYNTGWAGGFNLNETTEGIYKWKGLMRFEVATQGPYCAGDSVNVVLKTSGPLAAGNIFTVQLSDVNGYFANPVNIGSLTSINEGTINCIIPSNTLAGTGYKLRVVSSNPALVTLDIISGINITAQPVVVAGANASICNSATYQANGQAYNYSTIAWATSGDGVFSNSTSLNPVYTPGTADIAANSVTLTLTGQSNCGINNDNLVLSLTTNASADAGLDATLCPGDSIMLAANGGNTYSWATDASLSDNAISNPYANPLVTTTYTVTATGSCGTASDEVVVNVGVVPSVFIATNGSQQFCDGQSAGLTSTVNNGTSYQWYKDNTIIVGAIGPDFNATETGLYTLMVTSLSGCAGVSNAIDINVNPLPYAVVTPGGTQTGCDGDSILLSTTGAAGYTYLWKKDGVDIANSNFSNLAVTTAGSYVLIVADPNACTATSNVVNVVISPTPPQPTITLITNNRLRSSANTGNQWFLNGVLIQGATAQNYTPTQAGIYTVVVSNTYGCSSTPANPYDYVVGIKDVAQNSAFGVYPNPAKNLINVSLPVNSNNSVISLVNLLGEEIYISEIKTNGVDFFSIDVADFAEGVYFVNLKSNGKTYNQRILIQK